MEPNTPTQTPVMTWQAPRIPNHERGAKWYLAAGFVVIAFAVYGLISGDWSLAVVSVLCGAVYFLVRDHKFPDITCKLDEKGAQIGETFLAWSQVKGYWFVTTPTYTELHITPDIKHMQDLVIQTGVLQPMDIRTFLADKTQELLDKQERILDIFLRLTKL